MNDTDCLTKSTGLERVRYFPRQLITADDMMAEQQYFRQKLRRHNRFLHGWGAVCGLKVIAAAEQTAEGEAKWPWRVKVEAGYAIGPYGDEIYVSDSVCLDLATCLELVPDPCEPNQPPKPVPPKSGKLYVAIRYLECETRPVRVHPLGCACEDTLCEYSRFRDDFEISCLLEPPPNDPPPLLCELLGKKQLAPCPPCPASPWVLLAQVELPENLNTAIADAAIDNFVRRQLFSTALLQEQLIECCCEPTPAPIVEADLEVKMDRTIDFRTIQYTITVVNKGPSLAKNVVLQDFPPKDVWNVGNFKTTKGSWKVVAPANPPYVAQLGDMAAGSSVTLRFELNVSNSGGSCTNKVKVESSVTKDPNLANNEASLTDAFDPWIT